MHIKERESPILKEIVGIQEEKPLTGSMCKTHITYITGTLRFFSKDKPTLGLPESVQLMKTALIYTTIVIHHQDLNILTVGN
jgi:hypothetical protein